jgi:tRNA(Ile)-lysidine synthase
MDDPLHAQVRSTIERYRMLAPGETVVAAASGGPDSTALVHVLASLAGPLGLILHVAHFDHGLRDDAAEDSALVAAQSARANLPYHEGRGDARGYAVEAGCSVEDAARRLRYAFLVSVARSVGAQAIATGHTLDDQAETVLMRLLRGSGLRGLGGIPPVRWHEGIRIVRPLLDTPRAEVMRYLARHGLSWREDPTNRDPAFLRNRIRADLIPVLEGYNPHVREALARAALLLREDAEALESLAGPRIAGLLFRDGDAVRMPLEAFLELPVAVQRRALLEAIRRLRGNDRGVGFVHLEGARRLVVEGRTGSVAEIPGGLWVVRVPGAVEVTVRRDRDRAEAPQYRVEVPGHVVAAEYGVHVSAREVSGDDSAVRALAVHPAPQAIVVDRATAGRALVVRGARPGDRFRPFGMGGREKLVADFLRERGVPRHRRSQVPVIATEQGEVLWVVGHRAAEAARVDPAAPRVVKIEVHRLTAGETQEPADGGGEVSGRGHGGVL